MKIAVDLDDTITAYPEFFRIFTTAMKNAGCEIHIVTNREPGTQSSIQKELEELKIAYDQIEITSDKVGYMARRNIRVLFEDSDEYFLGLPEEMTVFKIREPGNFDFEQKKWVYGPRTGYSI